MINEYKIYEFSLCPNIAYLSYYLEQQKLMYLKIEMFSHSTFPIDRHGINTGWQRKSYIKKKTLKKPDSKSKFKYVNWLTKLCYQGRNELYTYDSFILKFNEWKNYTAL